jgi:regulator of protease activity HflC (stomatin/prohibitin superfamily)
MFITKKKHETAITEMEARLTQALDFNQTFLEKKLEELVAAAEAKLVGDAQKLFEAALEADRATRYASTEPYVEIISETFSEEGGVQLRLDWNAPFVNYLKRNGFTGPTDEAIVDNWLVSLSRERIAEGGSEFK